MRAVILMFTSGILLRCCMWLMFVGIGSQQVLTNPEYQSSKFLRVFMEYEPLPRMVNNSFVLWGGYILCGLLVAIAFLILNGGMSGGWTKRGMQFGAVYALLMIPWFEFYLPYNVMNEPLWLVILESLLWLVTLLLTALYMSFVMNLKRRSGLTAERRY